MIRLEVVHSSSLRTEIILILHSCLSMYSPTDDWREFDRKRCCTTKGRMLY